MWRQYSINPRVITRKLLTKSPIWRITKICFYLRLPLLSMRNQLALSSHQCEPLKKCCLSDTLTWLPKTSEINLELQFDKFVISEDLLISNTTFALCFVMHLYSWPLNNSVVRGTCTLQSWKSAYNIVSPLYTRFLLICGSTSLDSTNYRSCSTIVYR